MKHVIYKRYGQEEVELPPTKVNSFKSGLKSIIGDSSYADRLSVLLLSQSNKEGVNAESLLEKLRVAGKSSVKQLQSDIINDSSDNKTVIYGNSNRSRGDHIQDRNVDF